MSVVRRTTAGAAGYRIKPVDIQAGQFLDDRSQHGVLSRQPRPLGERTGGQPERERVPARDPGDTRRDRIVHTGAPEQGPRRLLAQVLEGPGV